MTSQRQSALPSASEILRILLIAASVVAPAGAYAGGDRDLLDARPVSRFLRLSRSGTDPLKYSIDTHQCIPCLQLEKTLLLRADGPVSLLAGDYNPLEASYFTTELSSEEPGTKALSALAAALSKHIEVVGLGATPGTGVPSAAPLSAADADASGCRGLAQLRNSVGTLEASLDNLRKSPPLTTDSLKIWMKDATRLAGVRGVHARVGIVKKLLEDKSKAIVSQRMELEDAQGKLRIDVPAACSELTPMDFARALDARTRAEASISSIQRLVETLGLVDGILVATIKPESWVGKEDLPDVSRQADFTLRTSQPTNAERKTIVLRAVTRSISEDAGGRPVLSTGDTVAVSTITVLKHRSLLREAGAGVIYNADHFKTYGTGTRDSVTVLAASESRGAVQPVVSMNWIMLADPHFLVQVGVAPSTTRPGVFIGGGIRIFDAVPVALSAGIIQSWSQQPKSIAEGSPVSGTAEIEADLKLTMHKKPGFYIAGQATF